MIDANKLNETINELEKQTVNIKSIAETHRVLEGILAEFKNNKELHKQSVGELAAMESKLKDTLSTFDNYLKSLQTLIKNIDDGLTDRVKEIKTDNEVFNKKLMDNYIKLENDFFTQIQALSTENKKMYLELENILSSKLERNKSDIEVEIRNQSNETQKSVEKVIENKFITMERELKSTIEALDKKLKTQQLILIGALVVGVVNLIMGFVRL